MMAGRLASAARSLAKPGSARSSMEAAVMPTAAMPATFKMRLIVSVKSAADEPNLSKTRRGDYGPVSPPAVIVRLRVQSALPGARKKDSATRGSTYQFTAWDPKQENT